MLDVNAIQRLQDFAVKGLAPADISGIDMPVVLVPGGYKIESLAGIKDRLLDHPRRAVAAITVSDVDSFAHYWHRFARESSLIIGASDKLAIRATIDYHSEDTPYWCEHTCTLALRLSDQWEAWMEMNDQFHKQVEFARFIEENAADIVSPSPAEMIEVSRELEAKKNVAFKSSTRLSDGQRQFRYEEEIAGRTTTGSLEIPTEFTVRMPVFYRGKPAHLKAWLRYRIESDGLKMGYEFQRPNEAKLDAFEAIVAEVATACGVPVLRGVIG